MLCQHAMLSMARLGTSSSAFVCVFLIIEMVESVVQAVMACMALRCDASSVTDHVSSSWVGRMQICFKSHPLYESCDLAARSYTANDLCWLRMMGGGLLCITLSLKCSYTNVVPFSGVCLQDIH